MFYLISGILKTVTLKHFIQTGLSILFSPKLPGIPKTVKQEEKKTFLTKGQINWPISTDQSLWSIISESESASWKQSAKVQRFIPGK